MSKPKFISIKGLFPDLHKIIPGWIRGTYYCITGATATGKSKFARYAFAEWTYRYCKANNIPFIVIYFALEESVDFFWSTIILGKLNERTGKQFTYYQFKGFHEGMEPKDYAEVELIMPEIHDMQKYIKVYDDISNPTGLLRTIEEELRPYGKLVKGEPITDEQGNTIIHKTFEYNDPDFHTVVIADHLGLLSPETNKFALVNTLHLAISKWSEYVVKLVCKRYNCIVANVHQQEMAGENNDNFKLNRLEPSEAKLGDNKIIGRDYMVTLALFNPAKYGLSSYSGYNVRNFGKNFRSLSLIKHRNGEPEVQKAMWFEGIGNKFEELPSPDKKQGITDFLRSKQLN